MKIGFVIPARLKSERLRKKILIKLGNQSALEWAIDRAKASNSIDEVVVATSPLNIDSEVSKVCIKKGVRYFQGDPDDVIKRLKDTAEYFDFDYVVNITPDNTLFSMYLIDLMVAKIKENPNYDFIKFKDPMLGTGIYALKREALQTICEFKNILDTEIWGPLFQPEYFNILEIEVPKFLQGNYRLTMDTPDDYMMLSKVFRGLNITKDNLVELDAVIEFLDKNPEIAKINTEIIQKSNLDSVIESIKSNFKENESEFFEIKNKYYGGNVNEK